MSWMMSAAASLGLARLSLVAAAAGLDGHNFLQNSGSAGSRLSRAVLGSELGSGLNSRLGSGLSNTAVPSVVSCSHPTALPTDDISRAL